MVVTKKNLYYLYAPFCQKYFSKSKIHSLNAAHDQKILSLSKNLCTMTAFLTFSFRSNCRINKSTSSKKQKRPIENQYFASIRKIDSAAIHLNSLDCKRPREANNSPSCRFATINKQLWNYSFDVTGFWSFEQYLVAAKINVHSSVYECVDLWLILKNGKSSKLTFRVFSLFPS